MSKTPRPPITPVERGAGAGTGQGQAKARMKPSPIRRMARPANGGGAAYRPVRQRDGHPRG